MSIQELFYLQTWITGQGWVMEDKAYYSFEAAATACEGYSDYTGHCMRVVAWRENLHQYVCLAHFAPVHKRFVGFVPDGLHGYFTWGYYKSLATALSGLRRTCYDTVAVYDMESKTWLYYDRSATFGRRFKRTEVRYEGEF